MVSVLKHSLMITGFVAITMLVIEYLNVLSRGEWQEKLSRRRWGQYLLAAFLGATPGCYHVRPPPALPGCGCRRDDRH